MLVNQCLGSKQQDHHEHHHRKHYDQYQQQHQEEPTQSRTDVYMMADRDLDHLPSTTDIADRDNALKRQVVIQVTGEGQENRSISPYFRKDQNEGLQQECGNEQSSKSFRSSLPPGQKHIFMTTPPKSNNQPFPLGHSSIKAQTTTTKQMAPPSKGPSQNTIDGTRRSVSPHARNISPAQFQVVTNHNNSPATEGILQGGNFLQVKPVQSQALIHALLQNRAPSPNQRRSPALLSRNQEGFQQKIVVGPSVSPNRVVTEPAHDGPSTIFITTDGNNQIINTSTAPSQLTSIPLITSQPSTQFFYMKKSPNVSQLPPQLKVQPLQGMQIKQDQLILNSIIVDKSQTASDKGIVSIQGTPSLLLSVPKANEHEQTRSSVYSPVMATTASAGPSISPSLLDQLTQARENLPFTNTTGTSVPNSSAITQAPILAKQLAAPSTSSITLSGQLPSGLRPRLVLPSNNSNLLSTGLGSASNVQFIPTSSTNFANPSQLNILSVPNSQLPSLTLTENNSLLQQVTTSQPTSASTQQRNNQLVVPNVAVNIQPAMVTSNPQLVPSITERLPVASCSTSNPRNASLLTSHPTLTERLAMTTNHSQAKLSQQQLGAVTNNENAVNYSAVVVSAPQLASSPVRNVRSEFPDLSTTKSISTHIVAPNANVTNSQFLKIITPNVESTQNQSGQVQKLVFADHSEKSIPRPLNTGFQTNQRTMLVNTDNIGQHGFVPVKGDHQSQFVSMKPLSFGVASDAITLIGVQGHPSLKTTSITTSTLVSQTPSLTATSSISDAVTSSSVNTSTILPATAKTKTVNALEYPKSSNAVLMPTLVEKIDPVPVTAESTVQKTVQSEMPHRAKQVRSEIGDLDTSFPFPKLVPKESKSEPTKNARAANRNDEVNPFFAQLRASAASSSFSSSLSTVGALPYKTFPQNTSPASHGQSSQLRRAVHSNSRGFSSFSNSGAAATNSQAGAYSLFSDSDRLSPSPPGFLSGIDQPKFDTSSEKQNSWDKVIADKEEQSDISNNAVKEEDETKGTSALKDEALSNNVDEKESIPQPFSMRLKTLNNFPGNHGCKSAFRYHPSAMNKAKVACITSTTKSLDLIRQNLQKFINKEIDQVIQEYIKKFFKPGIENIRFNNGSNAVGDEHMHSVCQKILEEAKKMYMEKRSVTPLRDIADNVSESGSTSGKRGANRKRRMSDTEIEVSHPVQKRRKKGRPPLHASGRVTPSKTIKQNEPVKREGPNWDPERLIPETLFVMGARANKALGFGATRGRLYIKHPELFKYSGDQDDKQWLFDHHHMPAIGGKAYILLYNDIQSLANTDEYRDNPNVILNELVYFTVPEWMMQKMKTLMQVMRTDVPKVKNPTISHAQHSNATNSILPTEAPSVIEPSNTSLALSSKLPFSTLYDDKPDSQISPANSEVFEMLSVENDSQATDISPFMGGTLDEEGPSPSISDLDGLDEDTTSLSVPFQLTASDPNS